MIPLTSRPCRIAFSTTTALTKKPLRSFLWYNETAKNAHVDQLFFSSSSEPPTFGEEKYSERQREARRYGGSTTEVPSALQYAQDSIPERAERRQKRRQRKSNDSPSLIQFSPYSYRIHDEREIGIASGSGSTSQQMNRENTGTTATVMKSMNASALLDPLNYCKRSANLTPHVKSGGRSISGTDAARRLLRGKKDLLAAARKLNNAPVLLDGHGVPLALFQHCVDMADALLYHYGPDVVECSFHNYYNNKSNNTASTNKTPLHVRVRRQDATNSCLPPPSFDNMSRISSGNGKRDIAESNEDIDWDHNLTLYLTVMERLAKNLSKVLELSSDKNDPDNKKLSQENKIHSALNQHGNREKSDVDDGNASTQSLSSPRPLWNVDILRGAYFDLEPVGSIANSTSKNNRVERSEQHTALTEGKRRLDEDRRAVVRLPRADVARRCAGGGGDTHPIRPFPIVEFVQQHNARSSGHVLIRLQGYPVANREFSNQKSQFSRQHRRQPVTLVFDACFQNPTPMNNSLSS